MVSTFDFDSLVAVCLRTQEEMQHHAARSINLSLVVRNWLFGLYIMEYEQSGIDRAEYGRRLLRRLSDRLKLKGIHGSSTTRLKLYRSFHQQYKEIGPTVSDQLLSPLEGGEFSLESIVSPLVRRFGLGWSHYVGDPLLRRFFEVFLFEDLPAADRRADQVYLDEVAACDLYLGLLGNEYGWEDTDGLSPTEREFNAAMGHHPDARYASFDYCFNHFQAFRERGKVGDICSPDNVQESCLQLGFYLASWGMLRGSSFLLWRSVRFFRDVVTTIANGDLRIWDVAGGCRC
jgi:hypothetical protein